MSTVKQTLSVPAAAVTLITTAADLVTGATLLSASYDNTPVDAATNSGYEFADFELIVPLGFLSNITVIKPVELYIIGAPDGTNYGTWTTSSSAVADTKMPVNAYVGAFLLTVETNASDPRRAVIRGVPLPPYKIEAGIRNNTGQTLDDGASHIVLKMYPYSLKQE